MATLVIRTFATLPRDTPTETVELLHDLRDAVHRVLARLYLDPLLQGVKHQRDQRAPHVLAVLELPRVDLDDEQALLVLQPLLDQLEQRRLPAAPAALNPNRHWVEPTRIQDPHDGVDHTAEPEKIQRCRVVVEHRSLQNLIHDTQCPR